MVRRFVSVLLVFLILSPAFSSIAGRCMRGTDCPMCAGKKTCALMMKRGNLRKGGKACRTSIRCCRAKERAAFSFIKELPSPAVSAPEPQQDPLLALFTPHHNYSDYIPLQPTRPPSLLSSFSV